MAFDVNNLFDIKKVASICLLLVVLTACSILLLRSGASVEVGSIKITKMSTLIEE